MSIQLSQTYVSSSRSFKCGSTVDAWVSYNSTTKNLSVFLTFADNPVFSRYSSSLPYIVDLKTILPEWVELVSPLQQVIWSSHIQYFPGHSVQTWSLNIGLLSQTRQKMVVLLIQTRQQMVTIKRNQVCGLVWGSGFGCSELCIRSTLVHILVKKDQSEHKRPFVQ